MFLWLFIFLSMDHKSHNFQLHLMKRRFSLFLSWCNPLEIEALCLAPSITHVSKASRRSGEGKRGTHDNISRSKATVNTAALQNVCSLSLVEMTDLGEENERRCYQSHRNNRGNLDRPRSTSQRFGENPLVGGVMYLCGTSQNPYIGGLILAW